jgi:hypothetical protein
MISKIDPNKRAEFLKMYNDPKSRAQFMKYVKNNVNTNLKKEIRTELSQTVNKNISQVNKIINKELKTEIKKTVNEIKQKEILNKDKLVSKSKDKLVSKFAKDNSDGNIAFGFILFCLTLIIIFLISYLVQYKKS